MNRFGRIWCHLHHLTYQDGQWRQPGEVIPEYVVATWVGLELFVAVVALGAVLAGWLW